MSMIPKTTSTAVLHEWQTDSLDTASPDNIQLEGDDIDASAATATTRLSNNCQISYKALAVTGTQEAVNKAGRRSELKYQILKASKGLKRDMEASLMANKITAVGAAGTERALGGIEAWFATNTSRGTGGVDAATGTTAATDGTPRAFTESLVKSVLLDCFTNGGDPDCIIVGPKHKQVMSGFTGNATRFKSAEDKKLTATIEIYQSDFGDLQVLPSRWLDGFASERSALVIQKDMWALATLRAPHLEDKAKTGDAEQRFVIAEFTLESRNEASSGIVADLT